MIDPCRPFNSMCRSLAILLLAGAGLCGCRLNSRPPTPLPDALAVTRENYPAVEKPVADSLAAALATPPQAHPITPRPLEVLAMTGGVQGAPYAAGVLVGWTKTGKRPTFDVVTGVSGGALIGVFGFLGPKYDAQLQRIILEMKTSDLIKLQPLYRSVHDGALASSNPAKRFFQKEVNDCFLADLRQAHRDGRRFFVGTMNLETKRLVVWDLGAIATSGRPDADDLVRKVLLASFSYPGLVPPVEFNMEVNGRIYRELHCDAGSTALTFLRFGAMPGWPTSDAPAHPGWLAGSNLYVLECRKLYSEPQSVKKRALPRAMTGASSVFEALARSDIDRLYAVCAATGMRYHQLSMPDDFKGKNLKFRDLYPADDAQELFELGEQAALRGPAWRLTPPGAEPGEESRPRDASNIAIGR